MGQSRSRTDGRYVATPAGPTFEHAHDRYEKTTKQTGHEPRHIQEHYHHWDQPPLGRRRRHSEPYLTRPLFEKKPRYRRSLSVITEVPTESDRSSRAGRQHTHHQHTHPLIAYEPVVYEPVLEVHPHRPQRKKSSFWKPSTWSCNRKRHEHKRQEEQPQREREHPYDIVRYNPQPLTVLPIQQPHAPLVTQPAAYLQPYPGAPYSQVYQQPGYQQPVYQTLPVIASPAPVFASAPPAVQHDKIFDSRGGDGEPTYILPGNSKITFRRTFAGQPTHQQPTLAPIAESPRQVTFAATPQPTQLAVQQATTPQLVQTQAATNVVPFAPILTTTQPVVAPRYALPARGPAHPDKHYPLVDQALSTMWGKQDTSAMIQQWRENAAARAAERERREAASVKQEYAAMKRYTHQDHRKTMKKAVKKASTQPITHELAKNDYKNIRVNRQGSVHGNKWSKEHGLYAADPGKSVAY